MKQYLRIMSLVLSVLMLLMTVGCVGESYSGTTMPTLAKPTDTAPGTTTTILTQPTYPTTAPTTIPVVPTTVPTTAPSDVEDLEERIALIVVIDTTYSVGEQDLEELLLIAKEYVNVLTDRDFCGVTILELPTEEEQEAISIFPLSQRDAVMEAISDVGDMDCWGGTIFFHTIMRAGEALSAIENVERKHILLLTDGEAGDEFETYAPYIEQNLENHITMSVITLNGEKKIQSQMSKTANAGGGRYYNFTSEELGLVYSAALEDVTDVRNGTSLKP